MNASATNVSSAHASVVIDQVTKIYDARAALNQVGLRLDPGQCVALVGHNGAGKSTLIKLMLGLIRPTHGQVRLLGEDPAGAHAARLRRAVGYLPENLAFHPSLTGRETLDFYARLKGVARTGNADLLARVGLEAEAARRRVGTYSKGMRQRLGLAQALLGRPRVLFLDEPTTGLDPALRQVFYEIVQELRAAGVTVLLSSHALTELEGQTDRIIVMNRGVKIADGTLTDLRHLADLPVRIRATGAQAGTVAEALGPLARVEPDGRAVECLCAGGDKVAVLRRLTSLPLADIAVTEPSLDELYAHFLRREQAA
ncbi:ABC transporter ATP-binding protein [Nitrospirillum sp. BR 11164]|uniref:ABC transporter ATP-binding protein n=1 Tax=Nitrospirillum sp. BR 11164 TaxID=3104324 RepID=UPI002AFF6810|nr:ABC transporter ATP-binding protein [Nitrospirillum sp. BR 11164]MEA1648217.1 ABC transporter ATP-binding protein [Nitrospirillum sp. BR 11164]